MKKFNLAENLKSHGFEMSDNAFGCPVFSLELVKKTEVVWYGVQEFRLRVQVVFNPGMSVCTVNFYDGFIRPFKSKVYDTVGKRTWNAIVETVKNKGFEMQEVA